MQIRVRPITLFFGFDIELPYLAYWCITTRQCVAYIHYPDTSKVKVKSNVFVSAQTFLGGREVDIGLPYLAHETMCRVHLCDVDL